MSFYTYRFGVSPVTLLDSMVCGFRGVPVADGGYYKPTVFALLVGGSEVEVHRTDRVYGMSGSFDYADLARRIESAAESYARGIADRKNDQSIGETS